MVKNPPAMETQVQYLGQEDPLEKEMATHSSILAWRLPWTEEPGGLQSMGSQRDGHDSVTNTVNMTIFGFFCCCCPVWHFCLKCLRSNVKFRCKLKSSYEHILSNCIYMGKREERLRDLVSSLGF